MKFANSLDPNEVIDERKAWWKYALFAAGQTALVFGGLLWLVILPYVAL